MKYDIAVKDGTKDEKYNYEYVEHGKFGCSIYDTFKIEYYTGLHCDCPHLDFDKLDIIEYTKYQRYYIN